MWMTKTQKDKILSYINLSTTVCLAILYCYSPNFAKSFSKLIGEYKNTSFQRYKLSKNNCIFKDCGIENGKVFH